MQGAVRQEYADFVEARCYVFRQAAIGPARRKHDGPDRPRHHCRFSGRQRNEVADNIQTVITSNGEHDRERLVRASLAFTQSSNRRLAASVAYQVITSYAFYSDDVASPNLLDSSSESLFSFLKRVAVLFLKAQLRSTVRASHGFCMETPVCGVPIFAFAVGTQRKSRHARIRTIVGQRFYQRIARTTLGAVDKRVGMAPVRRVLQFPLAVITHEVVGRHKNLRVSAHQAVDDLERIGKRGRNSLDFGY